MGGPDLLTLVLLVIIGGLVAFVAALFRLFFRVATRAPQAALRTLGNTGRGLFGPGGPPADIARRLRERNPSLSPGVGSGLSFSHCGCRGRLDFISDLTEIRFALDGNLRETLEVSTPGFMAQIAEDDPDAFRVRGSQALYRKVFEDPALLPMLRGLGGSFEWIVRPTEFMLQLRALPLDEEELWRWIKAAFALLQALPGMVDVSTIQVARVSASALAGSLCQVCGSSLGQGRIVYCIRCMTPHHAECWDYAGQCSTFACRERRCAA